MARRKNDPDSDVREQDPDTEIPEVAPLVEGDRCRPLPCTTPGTVPPRT